MPGRKKSTAMAAKEPQAAVPEPQRTAPLRLARSVSGRAIRPTRAEIDLSALVHNLAEVRRGSPGSAVLAMVKADAYGHGAVACANALAREGVEMFGVALVEEGLKLRDAGIRTPVLLLGGGYEHAPEEVVAADLTPVLYRPDMVRDFEAAARSAGRTLPVHVELETGMGRTGAMLEELPALIEALRNASHLQVEGVLSHFANADLADAQMNQVQVSRFDEALRALSAAGIEPKWRHLANSAGVLGLPGAQSGERCNMVRPGLMLYGESPAERLREAARLRPVLSWKTAITHLKRVPAGTPISYGGRWCATRESLIATLPVGYADGYRRELTNAGEVVVRGVRAPIAGTVCMDMCMLDVTHVPDVALGDEVALIGAQGNERVSAQELASRCGTISYEIFCGISARVPRVVG
ncbi:MAG: alanine racemase [Deltaproteobacteria bacterium]|nr:alanine racemase [Deltaproteobacteria bacterium]